MLKIMFSCSKSSFSHIRIFTQIPFFIYSAKFVGMTIGINSH